MLKSHEKFHSANGKRLVLIAEDEMINREILRGILEDTYELLFAEDGAEALRLVRANADTLSLILLDLMMPVVSGAEVLRTVKGEEDLRHIPVIVITGDAEAEVESLSAGASDFIPKPYPKTGVILARIRRAIELSEDRQIIQSTERDPLTGLYNREYFYRYAEQYDQHHKETSMDAIVVDVNHFHMINERFGNAYGDKILKRIGIRLRGMVQDIGGIVCRRSADTFLVYCPHGKDYQAILDEASAGLSDDETMNHRVRLRMGVYADADRTLPIERRFDRAKMAADTVRSSFVKGVGHYDRMLHERELYAEQLVEEFRTAIAEKQFKVYYQPKFDIRPDIPVLASAEALVRWVHPSLGLISPGVFIPLFEENGLIQALDHYVWRTAAEQIREWKDRLGFSVPVSVNVSRIDMYDPHLVELLQGIVADNGLEPRELLLEITESAYTKDSEQIIETVGRLRALGFEIEMDDFGTGYSSLNMISTLPIDALKLDMKFVRNAFNERKDTRMLEVIIDIADYLNVPVIAEGVETQEQLDALKTMGCDLVQGYYFSRPVPAEEYERFVRERKEQEPDVAPVPTRRRAAREEGSEYAFGSISHALSSGFERVYYVDADNDHYVLFTSEGRLEDLQIERSGADFFADAKRRIVRCVFSEDQERVSACLAKNALLTQLSDGRPYSITYRLSIGAEPTYYTLKAVKAGAHDEHHIVIGISNVNTQVTEQQSDELRAAVAPYTQIAKALAQDYFSIYYVNTETDRYLEYSAHEDYAELGIEKSGEDFFEQSRRNMRRVGCPEDITDFLRAFTKENIMKAMASRGVFTLTYRLMFGGKPTFVHMKVTRMPDPADPHIVIGISDIDAQMKREMETASALHRAREAANRDPLTGVKSKYAYSEAEESLNRSMEKGEIAEFALVLCDVNGLKTVNDTHGHQAGDELILSASRAICNIFSHSPVYRYGGDEFVVIVTGRDYENRRKLISRLLAENEAHAAFGGAVIACGLAEFVPGLDRNTGDVFARADAAMYANKARLKAQAAEQA